jgi:uncharacterized membrane protein
MSELLEIFMVVSFGASWPFNVVKSYRSRTTKGKSLPFLILIFIGYICGIISKLLAPSFKWYVLFFYVLNLIMVGMDLIIYYRNRKIDRDYAQKQTGSEG